MEKNIVSKKELVPCDGRNSTLSGEYEYWYIMMVIVISVTYFNYFNLFQ